MPKVPKTSLQYLKENVKDELDLLPADKRQRFLKRQTPILQIAIIILGVCGHACTNFPK